MADRVHDETEPPADQLRRGISSIGRLNGYLVSVPEGTDLSELAAHTPEFCRLNRAEPHCTSSPTRLECIGRYRLGRYECGATKSTRTSGVSRSPSCHLLSSPLLTPKILSDLSHLRLISSHLQYLAIDYVGFGYAPLGHPSFFPPAKREVPPWPEILQALQHHLRH